MASPENPNNKSESALAPGDLSIEFVRKLGKIIGKYGEAGGTVGREGYRLVFSAGDKTLEIKQLTLSVSLVTMISY